MFKGVNNYLVALIDPTFADAAERAGFYAEQFIMEAVDAGLGTCIVGGTFSGKHIGCRKEVYEEVAFLVTFGYEADKKPLLSRLQQMGGGRKHQPWRNFFDGSDAQLQEAEKKVPGLRDGLEAIDLAPSALNRQPVRIAFDPESGEVMAYTLKEGRFSAIDLGVAKYNFNAVTEGFWDWGERGRFHPAEP